MTSQPIRLSTNFTTLILSLTFTDYEWFPWSICNGCGMPAGNAYPSGHLVPSPILGLASAPIVETKFLELAMSLLDFSPRIPLGIFSILLCKQDKEKKEEIWLSPMTKPHTPTEMSKGQSDNINNATKKFDYTAVADRLRTVSWSNYSHPTGVVNRFTGPPSH